MKTLLYFFIILFFLPVSCTQRTDKGDIQIYPFGEGGTKKMIYDRRQRPQAILIGNEIHMVYNGGASAEAMRLVPTSPYAITFNLKTRMFSQAVKLPGKASKDHHYGPIIWADSKDKLHVLSGCHRTPGTHVISKEKASIGNSQSDWETGNQVASSLSYPSVSQVFGKNKLIYYRTGEHRSSWTYSTSMDDGNTWTTPMDPVTDLNMQDELSGKSHEEMDEASSYQSCLPSRDGRFIHVAFMYYDDNKKNLPEKAYNPLYKRDVGTLKTNLYYVKVDLETHKTSSFEGTVLRTPVSLEDADKYCKIWDTGWRGSGIPPDIIIEKSDEPAFLHVLTEEVFEKLNYYYVRRVGKEWKKTVIAPACHKWNSSHLKIDKNGILHAYLLMDDGYFESEDKGVMNSHGGGTRIEEWISMDHGDTWQMKQMLFNAGKEYSGWRFNNIQPIKSKDDQIQDGMLLFYGWNEQDDERAQAKAFLLIEER